MGELIVNGIKWAFIIGLSLTFMTAINNLIALINSVVFANIIGEVMGIVSMCLPFDANAVFGSIATAIAGLLSFLVSQKIYNLTSQKITI